MTANRYIINQTEDGDIIFQVNSGGEPIDVMRISGQSNSVAFGEFSLLSAPRLEAASVSLERFSINHFSINSNENQKVTATGTSIVGNANTNFQDQLKVGDRFSIHGHANELRRITSISSQTELTIDQPFSFAVTNALYAGSNANFISYNRNGVATVTINNDGGVSIYEGLALHQTQGDGIATKMYMKDSKLILYYYNGIDERYFSLDLTQTVGPASWTITSTEP